MENKINCINDKCRNPIKKIPSSSYVKCPLCKIDFYIFCHQFPNLQYKNIKCTKCPNSLYYFNCLKCSEVKVFNKFRMGSMVGCDCGLVGCYVKCNSCQKVECWAPDRKYEGIIWRCKNCSKPINFMTCDQCFYEIYQNEKEFQINKVYECRNPICGTRLTIRKCVDCNFKFTTSKNNLKCEGCIIIQNEKIKLQQQKQQMQKKPISNPQVSDSSCKVCYDRQAQYINTECFHLSVCEQCVKSMHNRCPICRTTGKFRKVFK